MSGTTATPDNVTAAIEQLEDQVREAHAGAVAVHGPDALAKLVTEPAAAFVADRAVRGGTVPHNAATVSALSVARDALAG